MKPKISTGYLTPQSNRVKQKTRRLSESRSENGEAKDLSRAMQINDSLFDKILECPIKRQLVLKLIASEKDNIEEYKRSLKEKQKEAKSSTPVRKLQKKQQWESPTALFRRRALEKLNRAGSSTSESDDRPNSGLSETSSDPPGPVDQILAGVVAFVEVRSKEQDRSAGVRMLLISMGATVRETFTRDVTHVIFKDGGFTTFQKANLRNLHLVSVLWIEACKTSGKRVPEKKFPALGTEAYNHNVSAICSQLHRDYEDIVREELRKSMATGISIPTTKDLIQRRRTLLTPSVSNNSLMFSQELASSQDREVADIIRSRRRTTYNFSTPFPDSPEISSDESDIGPIINGEFGSGRKRRSCDDDFINATVDNEINMELTNVGKKIAMTPIQSCAKENYSPNIPPMTFHDFKNPLDKSRTRSKLKRNNSKTISSSNTSSDQNKTTSSGMSALRLSNSQSFSILSKNASKASPLMERSSTMSNLHLSSEKNNVEKSSSTNMSSLRISMGTDTGEKHVELLADAFVTVRRKRKENLNSEASSDRTVSNLGSPPKQSKIDQPAEGDHGLSPSRVIKSGEEERRKGSGYVNLNSAKAPTECSNHVEEPGHKRLRKNRKRTSPVSSSSLKEKEKQTVSTEKESSVTPATPKSSEKVSDGQGETDMEGTTPRSVHGESAEAGMKTQAISLRDRKSKINSCLITPVPEHLNKVKSTVPSNTRCRGRASRIVSSSTLSDHPKPDERCSASRDNKTKTPSPPRHIEKEKHRGRSTEKEVPDTCRETKFKTPLAKSSLVSKRRRSQRLNFTASAKLDFDDSNDRSILPVTPLRNRRSTMEFQLPNEILSAKRKLKMDKLMSRSIVCTKMTKDDVLVFGQIVKKLGGFVIEDEVSDKTTHLVAGEAKRTINMLRAMVRGCWVLKHEWLLKSLEAGRWLPEEDYEETEFSPAVQKSRLQRQAFGPSYSMDIFRDCGHIYVAKGSAPRCSDMKELITSCKGKITTILRKADVIVGGYVKEPGVTCVNELWVLDCVTFNKKMSFKKYLLKQYNKVIL